MNADQVIAAAFGEIEEKPLPELGLKGRADAVAVICPQRSQAWFDARLGIPTASRIGDALKLTGERSAGKTRETYINRLVAERLLGYVEPDMKPSYAMERGTELEPKARAWYEIETGRRVIEVGLVMESSRRWACSPDGLCVDRGLEIKCPLHKQMIAALLAPTLPSEYLLQVQFSMWVCGLARWDVVFYTPEDAIPNRIIEVRADADLHAAFEKELPALSDEIARRVEIVRRMEG